MLAYKLLTEISNLSKYKKQDCFRYVKPVEKDLRIIQQDYKEAKTVFKEIHKIDDKDKERLLNPTILEIEYYSEVIKIYKNNDAIVTDNKIYPITKNHLIEAKKVKKELNKIKKELKKHNYKKGAVNGRPIQNKHEQ